MNNEEKILELLGQISQTLDHHGEILEHHTEILDRHSAILDRHSAILDRHSELLEHHGEILDHHSELLERHDKALGRLDQEVAKINLTLENNVQRKFDVIFDKLDSIDQRLEELPTAEDQMITNGRLDILEATVKKLSRDVAALKKAQ